jgi:hypothetical protein
VVSYSACQTCADVLYFSLLKTFVRTLACFQFFGFKRKYPYMAYCKESKGAVDALMFATPEELKAVAQEVEVCTPFSFVR